MNVSRTIFLSAASLGMALLLAAPVTASAQASAGGAGGAGGGQGQRRGGGRLSLATMPISAMDSIVMLKSDQKTKIEAIQATYKTDMAAAQGDQAKTREVRTKATGDVKAVLESEQATKLTEALPAVSLLDQTKVVPVAVLAKVKLTSDQWTKIKAAAKAAADKVAAADQADRRTARTAANDEFKTTVVALLTSDQKSIIEKAAAPAADAPAKV